MLRITPGSASGEASAPKDREGSAASSLPADARGTTSDEFSFSGPAVFPPSCSTLLAEFFVDMFETQLLSLNRLMKLGQALIGAEILAAIATGMFWR